MNKFVGIITAAALFATGNALAQPRPETHAGWGGSYRPESHFPRIEPTLPLLPLDNGHAGWGGSAPTPEQNRARAAGRAWDSISFVRWRMSQGSTMPARFRGGNDGFLATIAWELSRPGMQSAFQSAYGRSDRGVMLRFNYNGNALELFIPGTQLQQAVDALRDASSGNLGSYRFYEPPHVEPQIGAPRQAPLGVRLFGPQNGTETGLFWTILDAVNTVNPNATLSPDSGWIAPSRRSSAAPSPSLDFLAQAPAPGNGGWNGTRREGTTPTMVCMANCSVSGGGPGAGIDRH